MSGLVHDVSIYVHGEYTHCHVHRLTLLKRTRDSSAVNNLHDTRFGTAIHCGMQSVTIIYCRMYHTKSRITVFMILFLFFVACFML